MADRASATSSSSSDAGSINTSASTAGNSVFSRLRRACSIRDQAEGVLALATPPSSISEYPLIHGVDGHNYVLDQHFNKRPRTSWVGKHGHFLLRIIEGESIGRFWACNDCNRIFTAIATTSVADHLRTKHNITKPGSPTSSLGKRGPINDLFQQAIKRVKLPPLKSQAEQFRRALVGWIADSDVSFSMVQNTRFRELLNLISPESASTLLPQRHETARKWLDEVYDDLFNVLKAELHATPYKIHLSFDLWTSSNCFAMMGIVAHFFDVAGGYQTRLLGLPRICGSHDGETQARLLRGVVDQFDIASRVGCFQTDNATANDACIQSFLQHYNPDLSPTTIETLRNDKRARCAGHILNLVARALLNSDNADLIRALDPGSLERLTAEEEIELLSQWRRLGPLGKLHYAVHYVRHSPQRREAFSNIAQGRLLPEELEEFGAILVDPAIAKLQLQADNATRWHSVFHMIDRALALRDPLDVFIARYSAFPSHRSPFRQAFALTQSDWLVLADLKAILKPFKIITKKFEGRRPNFGEVVANFHTLYRDMKVLHDQYSASFENPEIEFNGPDITPSPSPSLPSPSLSPSLELEQGLEQRPSRRIRLPHRLADYEVDLPGLVRAPEEPNGPMVELGEPIPDYVDPDSFSTVQTSLRLALRKLKLYLDKMDETPLYWAAQILLPGCRMRWIERFFAGDDNRILDARSQFQAFFDRQQPYVGEPEVQAESPTQASLFGGFGNDFYDPPEAIHHPDEVEIYLGEPVRPVEDPIKWWLDNKGRFPQLSQLALEVLSIPSCSTECERCFSEAACVLGKQRHATGWDTLGQLQCVKNWQRNQGV
jgi:hypothetical protein